MSTPMDWQPIKAIQAKTGAMKRIYSPVDWKPERAIQAKMGWKSEKTTTNKSKHAKKALTTDAISKVCSAWEHPALAVLSKDFILYKFMNGMQLPALSNGFGTSSNDGISKGEFHKHMLEHEPLRAQYSNVLSTSVKSCPQVVNHHALQSIHTFIIMHLICSCIW